jgi:hypothetical protein
MQMTNVLRDSGVNAGGNIEPAPPMPLADQGALQAEACWVQMSRANGEIMSAVRTPTLRVSA